MSRRQVAINVLTVVAVLCAVVSTGMVVRKELFQPRAVRRTVEIPDWQRVLDTGLVLGNPAAPIKVVEFLDYQCPFCRQFALHTWPAVRETFGDRVALVLRHWPLRSHSFAYDAARAVECAARQGAFEQLHQDLLQDQALIGEKPFTAFAMEAGIPDMKEFENCFHAAEVDVVIEMGIAAAAEIGARGTPTVLVNGELLRSADSLTVSTAIQRALRRVKS